MTRRIRLSIKALQPEEERRPREESAHQERSKPRREDGERRQNSPRGSQVPTEEMAVTLGDFLKARQEEEEVATEEFPSVE